MEATTILTRGGAQGLDSLTRLNLHRMSQVFRFVRRICGCFFGSGRFARHPAPREVRDMKAPETARFSDGDFQTDEKPPNGDELSTAAGGRRLRRTHDRRGGQLVLTACTARQAPTNSPEDPKISSAACVLPDRQVSLPLDGPHDDANNDHEEQDLPPRAHRSRPSIPQPACRHSSSGRSVQTRCPWVHRPQVKASAPPVATSPTAPMSTPR